MSSATDKHARSPKGIVGGFEFTVFQRNLKKMTGHMTASGKGNQQK